VHGIDVTPADSPIYVSGLDKAMEYGEWPKLLLVFNPKRLDHTFRELSVTDPTRAELKHTFPTEVVSKDGTTVWFSRLNPDDPRLGPGYEAAYARWVPGDPRLALVALVLVQHPSYGSSLDVDAALATAANAAPPREES